jgi:hypothetical protein
MKVKEKMTIWDKMEDIIEKDITNNSQADCSSEL